MSARPRTPPTTPPAIAPVWDDPPPPPPPPFDCVVVGEAEVTVWELVPLVIPAAVVEAGVVFDAVDEVVVEVWLLDTCELSGASIRNLKKETSDQ